ncbi:MAG: hypothetical protein V4658_02545, partial [Bacteroidota bacterium]
MTKIYLSVLFLFFNLILTAQPQFSKSAVTPVSFELLTFRTANPPTASFSDTTRSQHIYVPSDLNANSGLIKKIYLKKTTAGTNTIDNFTIKLGQTSLINHNTVNTGADIILFNVPFINTGLTTCFSATSFNFSGTGWIAITLNIPYAYDNTLSLILDISTGKSTNFNGAAAPLTCSELPVSPVSNVKSILSEASQGSFPNLSNVAYRYPTTPLPTSVVPWPDFGIDVDPFPPPVLFNSPPIANYAYDEGIDTVWVN